MRKILLWLAVGAGCASSLIIVFADSARAASVFFTPGTTSAQIQHHYVSTKKVRVLIVPGHQPAEGGTVFNGVYERNVVVDIADALAARLSQDPHYEVMVSRTKTAWHPTLQTYFDTQSLSILSFIRSQALEMESHRADGSFVSNIEQVHHNDTSPYAALQLYGINKWTNDNDYDITLHLHINDYARPRASVVGVYDGFAVYVPDHQYSNAEASKTIGEAIAVRLNAYHATSTLPVEDQGVVPDQKLIAIGSNNSIEGASVLIEYGYIYEPQFQHASVRSVAIADYAYQTYLGLQDFFNDPVVSTSGSLSFPYDWRNVTGQKNERGPGVYALQAALRYLGYYPPSGKTFSECPISGKVGACTRSAIIEYQRVNNLDTTGLVGPKTRTALTTDLTSP